MSRIHCQHARTYRAAGKSAWLEVCETCGEIVGAGVFQDFPMPKPTSGVIITGAQFEAMMRDVEIKATVDTNLKPSDVVNALLRSVPGVKP